MEFSNHAARSQLNSKDSMDKLSLYRKYEKAMRSPTASCMDERLLMAREGTLSTYYAPFDWVNQDARVTLVGITPGKTQANNALAEARKALAESAAPLDVIARAKRTAAFSGAMRGNLIAMLDRIGLHKPLGLRSCEDLFGSASLLLQTTSVLPFPIFVDGENYKGTPDPLRTTFLQRLTEQYFVPTIQALPKSIFLPLGPVPAKVMLSLADAGVIDRNRVLDGIPHPSGPNGERISYFLGKKSRSLLSKKTDANKLDAALARVRQRVSAWYS
jgi:hypothetical protein